MSKQTFRLKPEHIKLLQKSYIDWWGAEAGSAVIDCKRPYGNGDHLKDMCEILNIKRKLDVRQTAESGDVYYDEKQEESLLDLHRQTEGALEVILRSKSFKPGLYEADVDEKNWKWVKK